MTRFFFNSILWLLFLMSSVLLLDSIKISDDYVIHKTKGTSYHKIAWNLNLINNQPERIKGRALFMGSSLVQEGLSDSLLSNRGFPALNCATNGNGNELVLYFLKRMLPFQPSAIYLQVYKTDKTGLHGLTPMLLRPAELLESGQSLNLHFIEYMFKRAAHVCDYLLWSLKGEEDVYSTFSNYGQVNRDSTEYTSESFQTIDTVAMRDYFNFFRPELVNYTLMKERGQNGALIKLKRVGRKFYYGFRKWNFIYNGYCQTTFVSKAFELCNNYQMTVHRLYIPLLADAKVGRDFDRTFYVPTRNSHVLSLKNFVFLDSVVYWNDRSHLSREGSYRFTEAVLDQGLLK